MPNTGRGTEALAELSRVLLVADDPRIDWDSRWWHLRLYPNKAGIACTTQIDPSWGERESWWSYIDYYDGHDDWSFPYAAEVISEIDTEDVYSNGLFGVPYSRLPVKTLITQQRYYLNVLMSVPPGYPHHNLNWREGRKR